MKYYEMELSGVDLFLFAGLFSGRGSGGTPEKRSVESRKSYIFTGIL